MKVKLYNFIIIFILFNNISSLNYCNNSIIPKKGVDCEKRISDDEKKLGIKYCCYVRIDDNISCQGLNEEEYDEIYSNVLIGRDNFFTYQIDCHSFFLISNVLYLILLYI